MNTDFEIEKAVAFTGHRNMTQDGNVIRLRLANAIEDLYNRGARYFISGFALGFDMMAAEEVIRFKQTHADVKLVAAIPFRGQSAKFPWEEKNRYDRLVQQADLTAVLSEWYFKGCLLERDAWMVSKASSVIAYYDGSIGGGTYYTVNRAARLHRHLVNIF